MKPISRQVDPTEVTDNFKCTNELELEGEVQVLDKSESKLYNTNADMENEFRGSRGSFTSPKYTIEDNNEATRKNVIHISYEPRELFSSTRGQNFLSPQQKSNDAEKRIIAELNIMKTRRVLREVRSKLICTNPLSLQKHLEKRAKLNLFRLQNRHKLSATNFLLSNKPRITPYSPSEAAGVISRALAVLNYSSS